MTLNKSNKLSDSSSKISDSSSKVADSSSKIADSSNNSADSRINSVSNSDKATNLSTPNSLNSAVYPKANLNTTNNSNFTKKQNSNVSINNSSRANNPSGNVSTFSDNKGLDSNANSNTQNYSGKYNSGKGEVNEFDENASNRNTSNENVRNQNATNKNRFKSDVFSISGAIKEANVANTTKSANIDGRIFPKIEGRNPFDVAKVKEMLDKYVEECKDSALIANLTAHNFKLEGNTITLFVDNDLQIKEMNSKLSSIQYQFAKLLDNGDLILSISFSDESMKEDKKRFYTKEEIYNLFKKENPSVEDLKNLFALDIDYK